MVSELSWPRKLPAHRPVTHFVIVPISSSAPEPPTSNPAQPATTVSRAAFWRVFGSTFVTIFLAELGDKTQVTTLLMSAQSQAPWIVFLGAGSALITTSLLGVLVGQWLARRVSPGTLDMAAGAILLGITVGLLWDISQL
ncbi:MAG: TMEM165/GDT1 family protein [Cyanobacteria bacterium J06638_6]